MPSSVPEARESMADFNYRVPVYGIVTRVPAGAASYT
jgi:hypothetical protein